MGLSEFLFGDLSKPNTAYRYKNADTLKNAMLKEGLDWACGVRGGSPTGRCIWNTCHVQMWPRNRVWQDRSPLCPSKVPNFGEASTRTLHDKQHCHEFGLWEPQTTYHGLEFKRFESHPDGKLRTSNFWQRSTIKKLLWFCDLSTPYLDQGKSQRLAYNGHKRVHVWNFSPRWSHKA